MPYLQIGPHCESLSYKIYTRMQIYPIILVFLLILVPLMAIFFILSYKLEHSFDISSVKCIALSATLFNLFLSVLLLIKYDFDALGYQFITDLTTSVSKLNQSNIEMIQFLDRFWSLDFNSNYDYYYSQLGFKSLNLSN